jgi:hypothetical protein
VHERDKESIGQKGFLSDSNSGITFIPKEGIMKFLTSEKGYVSPRKGLLAGWVAGVIAGVAVFFGATEKTEATYVICDWDQICYRDPYGHVCYAQPYDVLGQKLPCGYENQCQVPC